MPLNCVHAWQVAATNAPGSLIGVKVSKWDDYDATACKIRSYMRRSGRFDFIQPARSGFKVVPFGQNPPSERPSPTAPPRGRNRRECRRTKRTHASVRPTAYAPGEVPAPPARQPPSLPRSARASSPAPENPHLSGGTSGRHWAASAGSLRASRRFPGQSLCGSRTYCPACGVCVTTTLLRCPNGVRDH